MDNQSTEHDEGNDSNHPKIIWPLRGFWSSTCNYTDILGHPVESSHLFFQTRMFGVDILQVRCFLVTLFLFDWLRVLRGMLRSLEYFLWLLFASLQRKRFWGMILPIIFSWILLEVTGPLPTVSKTYLQPERSLAVSTQNETIVMAKLLASTAFARWSDNLLLLF